MGVAVSPSVAQLLLAVPELDLDHIEHQLRQPARCVLGRPRGRQVPADLLHVDGWPLALAQQTQMALRKNA